PIYVAHDSADVWANPDLFHLGAAGHPTVVAGVPPDYFSATGQRWGNPIYRWDVMQKHNFAWWTQRLDRALTLFDLLRLDHFRGFAAYWEVPAKEETAINGRWVNAPGLALFQQVEKTLGRLPLLAENLGIITDEVTALMKHFGFSGMAVLQFAFGQDADMEFLPHNFTPNLVAYTGTHDNDTLIGWWTQAASTRDAEAEARERTYAHQYLNLDPADEREVHWRCIRLLMGSVARLVVTPLQDILGLGSEARMNTPGTESGNWTWRVHPDQLTQEHIFRLKALTRIYGRSVVKNPMIDIE
ncbi:MAG TPA: 4-alpha-glucanotransferase, partial [Rhodothermales bacterium]|nr:4-alpha-glucanotransferase [Rhodothermales bacterium]